ncbi:MAG TPA: rhodanese-like domain-containing protein [Chitinophagaceae bacterium]|nr:rhodanese-like domain-containing protein [Chitinophagaceae bacterium]MCC6635144.1 rhodanese-like domain-containing protein [Chitinophagaceae bacterium]HMZ45727.1 rhodanese-like domain-containing protein [Chitinophagaceae bacterium]HNF29950.1 rhodanese-like domain-containing protein [Chitinophagaceae bacterium]HNJ57551.1 rhodanese-like domain-containing protein [Chitinophagaceae bacterium]
MQNITVEELKERLDTGNPINLIDVREETEHADFNIGGINFTLRRMQDMAIEDIEHLKNEEVICYCRSGQRSNMACLILEYQGFTNTINVIGGVNAWQEKFGR